MSNLTISLDDQTKKRFNRFCADVGLSASSVITVYINTVLRENRIPFSSKAPPAPTRKPWRPSTTWTMTATFPGTTPWTPS